MLVSKMKNKIYREILHDDCCPGIDFDMKVENIKAKFIEEFPEREIEIDLLCAKISELRERHRKRKSSIQSLILNFEKSDLLKNRSKRFARVAETLAKIFINE